MHLIRKWDQSEHKPKAATELDIYAREEKMQQYLMHQKKWEDGMQQYLSTYGGGRSCEECSKRKRKVHIPGTHMSPLMPACKHIMIEPDPKSPKVYLFPVGDVVGAEFRAGYYICDWCKRAQERYELDHDQLLMHCWPCLAHHVSELKKKDPTLFVDLSQGKFIAPFVT